MNVKNLLTTISTENNHSERTETAITQLTSDVQKSHRITLQARSLILAQKGILFWMHPCMLVTAARGILTRGWEELKAIVGEVVRRCLKAAIFTQPKAAY